MISSSSSQLCLASVSRTPRLILPLPVYLPGYSPSCLPAHNPLGTRTARSCDRNANLCLSTPTHTQHAHTPPFRLYVCVCREGEVRSGIYLANAENACSTCLHLISRDANDTLRNLAPLIKLKVCLQAAEWSPFTYSSRSPSPCHSPQARSPAWQCVENLQ